MLFLIFPFISSLGRDLEVPDRFEDPIQPHVQYRTAALVAIHGFSVWANLENAVLADFSQMTRDPAVLALARRCIEMATEEACEAKPRASR